MRTSIKRATLVAIALACAAAAVASRPVNSGNAVHVRPTPRYVEVARVEQSAHVKEIRLSGVTRALKRAKLAFTLGERVVSRPVDVGDVVNQGQILARLDDTKIVHGLAEAEASLREVEARITQVNQDHTRIERLVSRDASAAVELEKIVESKAVLLATKAAVEARVSEARRMLKETVLKAPFDATVTEVLIEPGEFATPGGTVMVLSGNGEVEIEVEVPESIIGGLSVRQSVRVDLPLAGRTGLAGTVAHIGRTALGPGRLFPVLVTLQPNSPVAPGMTAEVVVVMPSRQVLSVPLAAVINPGGRNPAVIKVEMGRVRSVPVRVGDILEDRVVVKGNVGPRDLVVSGGHHGVLDGEAVEVVTDERL